MSEVSPSADPTPSAGPAPGPWAPPDPGAWDGSASGYGPPPPTTAPPPGTAPPYGFAPPSGYGPPYGFTPPGGAAPGPAAPAAPYGYPWSAARPAAPLPRSGNRSATVGVVIAAATVLVLVICGAVGAAALSRYGAPGPTDTVAEGPYDGPYHEDGDEDEAWQDQPALSPSAGSGVVQVVYEVTGRGPVDLEYYDANGTFVQDAEVRLPWRLTFRARSADRVMVLAHNADTEGPVNCRILVDGEAVDEVSAERWGASCFG
ncbi:MmpS family transport accessory protein [Micromonospora sp. WMMD812]|uniref:MmpS family transport accessory protein n=1 Tax=Micromonospora sp. WMMD812 TaxID=3015152 RepID=UPI00248CE2CE|nr:MmpS family transport accessory protein [Micromonospora sp. WMMD812]WBB66435.1 MmpS family transport accessory protein [Micromonospora sp. WMMD812]